MDDLFAILSLACILIWLSALIIGAGATENSWRSKYRAWVKEWRGFFIALIIIAIVRIGFYEMFWIPSASMQPSLREGEFVVVDKRAYGSQLPLLNVPLRPGTPPQRGDIVVFRYPSDESVFYIKRIIALPGDTIQVKGNQLMINNAEVTQRGPAEQDYIYLEDNASGVINGIVNIFSGDNGKELASQLYWEEFANGWYPILLSDPDIAPAAVLRDDACEVIDANRILECVIPAEHYFVMGDNRHRSNDSRFWGFVPRQNLVGPAFIIAISLDSWARFFQPLQLYPQPQTLAGIPAP